MSDGTYLAFIRLELPKKETISQNIPMKTSHLQDLIPMKTVGLSGTWLVPSTETACQPSKHLNEL